MRVVLFMAVLAVVSGCAMTVEQERQLGADFSRKIASEKKIVRDPVVVNYVRQMGSRLAAAAGPQPFPFTFNVIVDPNINAFAGPAGYVYVHTGLLMKARNSAEVAGVLSHEISHVTLRHVSKSVARQQRASGISSIVSTVTNEPVLGGVAGAGASVYNLRYDRQAEAQADSSGLRLMSRAGYDPRGMVSMFELLQGEGSGGRGGFLSSHPGTASRVQAMRAEISRLPPRQGLVMNDGQLARVQARIRGWGGAAR
ncbi:MAG: M48 family metallopeptidase [Myxococcota bacterium]